MEISVTGRAAATVHRIRLEELDQVELIEQVVLVPEHQLVIGADVIDGGAPALQLGLDVGDAAAIAVAGVGQVARANRQELRIGEPVRHRAVVQRVGPDRHRARQSRAHDEVRGRGAVGDVMKARGPGAHEKCGDRILISNPK